MRENCIICEKKIHRASSRGKGKLRRGIHAMTCGKSCSKIYARLNIFFYKRYVGSYHD